MSDSSAQEDGVYINGYFDAWWKFENIDDPEAPASRGFRVSEQGNMDRVIYFFTRDGVYLGQLTVPASK